MTQRIKYIDISKGILIILLVFAHFRSVVNRMPYDSSYFEYVYSWNYIFTSFYMPAFFIISGFCSNFNKSVIVFFSSQIKSLIVPLISLWFISTILNALLQCQDVLEQLKDVFVNGMGLWFLQALFIGKIIVFISEMFRVRFSTFSSFTLLITFCLMVFGVMLDNYDKTSINIFYYRHALISSFWISVGAYLKKNDVLYVKSIRYSLIIYPVLAIISLFTIIHPSFTAKISITTKTLPLFLLYSYVGTMFLLSLCNLLQENRILEYWGKHSLVVYGLHFPPYLYFANRLYVILSAPITLNTFIVYISILFFVEYLFCWVMIKLFEKQPGPILLGRW